VLLLHTPDLAAVRGQREVAVTQPGLIQVGGDRIRGDRARLLLAVGDVRLGDIETLIVVVREHDRVAARRPSPGAGWLHG